MPPRCFALLIALPLAGLPLGTASAKRHPVQRTIQPRVAVHYYHPKPPHRSFTLAPRHPRLAHG